MTLTIRKRTTKTVPVEVLRLKVLGPLSPRSASVNFKCSACGGLLGAAKFGIAWIRDGETERSMRLCANCVEKAGGELIPEGQP
jgi:hypothetical protein